MKKVFTIKVRVWLYPGPTAWHFISVPKTVSSTIKKTFGAHARGWGSLRVGVKIGKTEWNTSIFPEKKSGMYLLPLKALVRKAEDIMEGDIITVRCTLL